MATKTARIVSSPSSDRATDYAVAVVSDEIVAGPHVRNACRRHLKDLEDGHERGLWFDPEAAEYAYDYFGDVLRLSEGQFEGSPFKLEPSQAFIVGSLFGWKRGDGFRRFRRAYCEEGKGNGKSPLAGGLGLIGLASDDEAGAEIYAAASKRDQAQVLFRDAVKMVKAAPSLKRRLKLSGGEGRENNIAHLKSGSFFRPVSREAGTTGSGPRPHFVLVDEIHELPNRSIIETLERGFKFRRQPLIFMITNSGSDRNSVCREEHDHAIKVAAGNRDARDDDAAFLGEAIDDSTFSYVCALDAGDDPLNDPSCWIKANPLLGVTITEEYLAGVVKQAKDMPGRLNGILRLHFCVWTDAETAWMTRELLEPCIHDFELDRHHGASIAMGLDLSQNRDITALAAAVQTGEVEVEVKRDGRTEVVRKPTFDAWIEAWTPKDTMASRELLDKLPYSDWVRDGFLHAPKGASISYLHVAQTLAEYDRDYKIAMVAYDRFAFRRFEEDVEKLGLDLEFVEHPQGGLKKGKASEAMKAAAKAEGRDPEGLWMPGSLRILEDAILERRIRLRRNPVLISAMMSAVTDEDKWDNRWLAKQRSLNKIDAAVALCMAVGAASVTVRQPAFEVLVF
jgi:phage terminase large subunit-like protein